MRVGFTLRRSGTLVLGKKPNGAEVGYLHHSKDGSYSGYDTILGKQTGKYTEKLACRRHLERIVLVSLREIHSIMCGGDPK